MRSLRILLVIFIIINEAGSRSILDISGTFNYRSRKQSVHKILQICLWDQYAEITGYMTFKLAVILCSSFLLFRFQFLIFYIFIAFTAQPEGHSNNSSNNFTNAGSQGNSHKGSGR